MKLSQVKALLPTLDNVAFRLENGTFVPGHFHVTEVGMATKHFIDCGGTIRTEKKVNFQLWNANDLDHRLKPTKLLDIIELSEKVLGISDLDIEVEYQGDTIGKFGLDYDGSNFLLTTKQTDCLAKDNCGIPSEKPKVKLSEIKDEACCAPNSGCC